MIEPIALKNGRKIGPGFPSYIIAEIGSNHDGSLDKAKKLISLAKKAGADAAKFQSFQAHTLVNAFTKDKNEWKKEAAFEVLENMELPFEWHHILSDHAKSENIDFLSTPFDHERLQLLNSLDLPLIKIASGDLTNTKLLQEAATLKKPIVISTGAATLKEVQNAHKILTEAGAKQIAILQCVSCYPAHFSDANILAMKTIQETFHVPVGYSDHAPGYIVPLGAIALGASIIEKHFTDDKTLKGPDHPHSLNPEEFKELCESIRNMEKALGSGKKEPCIHEMDERVMARRAVYASKTIPKQTKITEDMIKTVRHAFSEGIPATEYDLVIGSITLSEIKEHEILSWDKLTK